MIETMPEGLDPSAARESAEQLRRILVAIEAGEMAASAAEVDYVEGAVAALDAVASA